MLGRSRAAELLRRRFTALREVQALAAWLNQQPQLGCDVFARGQPEQLGLSAETEHQADVVAVHIEQLEFVEIYAQQISRWRTERPSAGQIRELNRMGEQNQQLRAVTEEVLTLIRELQKGTIDRIMEMSDIELGLHALLNPAPDTTR